MTPALADQIIKALKIPVEELRLVRAMLEQFEPDAGHDAAAVLVAWTGLALVGMKRDIVTAIEDLRKADTVIAGVVHDVLEQADQYQEKLVRRQRGSEGDDPHGD